MKKSDIKIISCLRQNARMQITEMAKKTKLPLSTIHDKLKKQIQQKITKYTALLDFDKIGYTTRAHILLATDPQNRENLTNHLKDHPNINTIHKINNGWNFIIETAFKTMQELEQFTEHLENEYNVHKKEIHYTLAEIKREQFLTKQIEQLF